MYKLVLFFSLGMFVVILQAVQFDQQLAVQTLFQAKYAVNRAVHAAAQQTDLEQLASGKIVIDAEVAQQTAYQYLQANLQLDHHFMPRSGSFLREQVEILELVVLNDGPFPATYIYEPYNYQVTIDAPSVIMIIRMYYPRTFNLLGPIEWEIKGVAETVSLI